jgi:hypothetical protein
MPHELTSEEKMWCLEQAIIIMKEAGHGGEASLRDVAGALQSLYQALCTIRQSVKEDV